MNILQTNLYLVPRGAYSAYGATAASCQWSIIKRTEKDRLAKDGITHTHKK